MTSSTPQTFAVNDLVRFVDDPSSDQVWRVTKIETDLRKCRTHMTEVYVVSEPHPTMLTSAIITHLSRLELAPPVSRAYFEIGDRVYMPNDRPEIVWKIVKIKSRAHGSSKYYLECFFTREWQLNYTLIVSQRDIYHIADRP